MSIKKIKPVIVDFESHMNSAYEALKTAGLNYIVEQSPHLISTTGKVSDISKGLYRSDTNQELGSVGVGYEPVQNVKAFSFFDTICQTHGAIYKSAMAFDGGAKVILKAEFPQPVTIAKDDDVMKQFILVNGFNGAVGLHANFMLERLICTNGLRAMVPDAESSVHLKHTKNIEFKMEDAMKVLTQGLNYFDKFIEMSKVLAQKTVDTQMVDKFIDDVFGEAKSIKAENKQANILNLFENGKGNKGNTAWDLYNAVVEHVDYFHGKDENRLATSIIGSGVNVKEKAFKIAMAL